MNYRARLKYFTWVDLTATVAEVPVYETIRLNSIYDPEYAVGGHKALGMNELMAFYDHFIVTHTRYILHYTADTTLAEQSALAIAHISGNASTVATLSTLLE